MPGLERVHSRLGAPAVQAVLLGAGLVGALGLVLMGVNYVVQVLAMLVALGSGLELGRRAWANLGGRGRAFVREVTGPIVVVALTLGVYWRLVRGLMPWSADHLVHQTKAYVLAEQLIPSGRLTGWSLFSGAGYPAEALYPMLGDLWVAVVRYATFKALSWEATYAYAILGMLLFFHLTAYYVGRRLYGPVAGLVAALAVLTDHGGYREGGWVFTMQFGVWPLALSAALSLLLLERLWALRHPDPLRGVPSAAVVAALAVLAHPMALLFLVVALPLWGLAEYAASGRPWVWRKALAVGVLALLLAGFWFLPYTVRAPEFSAHVSALWKSMPEIGRNLVTASLYGSADPWIFVLGISGLLLAAAEGRPFGRFSLLTAAALLLVASVTFYAATRAEYLLPKVEHIQFQRFVLYLKLFVFLGAGFLVQRLVAGLGPGSDGGPARALAVGAGVRAARPLLWRTVILFVPAVFLTPVISGWVSERLAPQTRFKTRRDRVGLYSPLRKLLGRIRAEAEARPTGFFRVAYFTDFNDHRIANGPVLSGLPFVKCSFIPSETYKYLFHPQPRDVPRTTRDFEVLSVRFILATRPLPASVKGFELLERAGPIALYEKKDYVFRPATLRGPGEVRVVRFSDQRIELEVSGLAGETELVLHTPYFPNWRATQAGRTLHIRRVFDLAPHVPGLMAVRVRNGRVVFRYGWTWAEYAGRGASLLGLLVLAFLWRVRRGRGLAARLWTRLAWLPRFARWVLWAGVLAGVSGLAFKAVRADRRLAEKGYSLIWRLDEAKVFVETSEGRRRCWPLLDGRFWCGTKAFEFVGFAVEEWNLKNRRGLWAHPLAEGPLVIEFPRVLLGRRLEIEHGILASGGGGKGVVRLEVWVDGEHLGTVDQRVTGWFVRRFDTGRWAGRRATVRFRVSARDISARHFCFDARIEP